MSARDLSMRALVVKHVADAADAAIRDRRKDLAGELTNGDRVNVTDPDGAGTSLGKVWRTEPKGTAAVIDRDAFTAWMLTHYPDHVGATEHPIDGRMPEVLDVLREHAPHLLTTRTKVLDWAENEVLELTRKSRQSCGPGHELDVPGVAYEPPGDGVITVRLSEDGPAVIEQLWRDGRIDLHSGEIRALPAGGDDS